MSLAAYLLHHSESIDPTLLDWIRHEIDAVLGLGPATIVALLGALLVAFPVSLLVLARRATPAPAVDGMPAATRRVRRSSRRAWRQG